MANLKSGRVHCKVPDGTVFGGLTLLHELPDRDSAGNYQGLFLCACGASKAIRLSRVTSNTTKSCGCLIVSVLRDRVTSHGQSLTREFRIWQNMKYRCETITAKDYKDYGAKGISVDPDWQSYENFIRDMGFAPSNNHTLDRKDNLAGYSKSNCRWATYEEQMNNRSNSVKFLFRGESLSRPQIARKVGMKAVTLIHRLKSGMDLETAVTLPVGRRTPK